MKTCAVYRSNRKQNTFLYVEKKDDFSAVPQALLDVFGKPVWVMTLAPARHETIAGIGTSDFIDKLSGQGFYLQMPKDQENWLYEHRQTLGLSPQPPNKNSA